MNKHDKTTDLESLSARPTIQQAASVLGLSDKTIRRWLADGRIKGYRLGARCIRLDRESLLAVAKPIGQPHLKAVPRKRDYAEDIQQISWELEQASADLTEGDLAKTLGAADFLFKLLRADAIIRERETGEAA